MRRHVPRDYSERVRSPLRLAIARGAGEVPRRCIVVGRQRGENRRDTTATIGVVCYLSFGY